MKSLIKFGLLSLAIVFFTNTALSKDSAKVVTPKRFFVAKTAFGVFAQDIKPYKLDAALNFVSRASREKYQYVPFAVLDSVFQKALAEKDTLTSLTLARKLDADFFVFIRVNKLENMLRIDMSAIDAKDTNTKKYGVGYAAIRYRKLTDMEQLTDPALLTATMRAFALAVGDSSLFVVDDTLKVQPVPTLVIGGINYVNDEHQDLWEIFRDKEISSYDAVINIFDEIKDSPDFAIYDIETRDTLYSLFNLVLVENYNTSTSTELKTLYNMDVNYFITGILSRDTKGAILDLYFCRILKDGKLAVLDKATGFISEDTIVEYKKILRETVRKLMNKKPWLRPTMN
jgi:hypothetical protein